jgi:hypothetical protein
VFSEHEASTGLPSVQRLFRSVQIELESDDDAKPGSGAPPPGGQAQGGRACAAPTSEHVET